MTLIEVTVVIMVLIALVALLFLSARAWKRGSDRAGCTMQLRQIQVAVRSYANLNDVQPGESTAPVDLESQLIGNGQFLELAPECPGGGTYTMGGNTVPAVGDLYMTCSLAASRDHVPETHDDW